jgi:2-amino-4-hydroxy-6-hydroxymethyldihydropteridine diphosphokinase
MTTADSTHIVYVSLGSNIEPEKNLAAAIQLLRERCVVLALSSAYRTPPMGFTEQADFLNMAVKLTTPLSPLDFKSSVLAPIEQRLGRVRDPLNKNAPRTIDLDISLWDDAVLDYGEKLWHIPEPDILRFAHVAVPLAEIAPDYVHPETGETLKHIAARFDTSGMRREELQP